MIETFTIPLGNGIELSCRARGRQRRPGARLPARISRGGFVWDELLEHFSARYRCVAPNLRGYERSSAPSDVEAYRAKHLVADISSLIDALGGQLAALVAHDWGGALAWGSRRSGRRRSAASSSSTRRTRRRSCASCATTRRSRRRART
jgi:hypothetical protein